MNPYDRRSSAPLIALALAVALSACGKDEAPKPAAVPTPAPKASFPQPAPEPKAAAPAPSAPAAASKPEAAPAPDPDKKLAGRVKATLEKTQGVQGQQIDVTAKDGAVTLWGTVGDPTEKEKAVEAAKSVPGVKKVDNKLAIVKGS